MLIHETSIYSPKNAFFLGSAHYQEQTIFFPRKKTFKKNRSLPNPSSIKNRALNYCFIINHLSEKNIIWVVYQGISHKKKILHPKNIPTTQPIHPSHPSQSFHSSTHLGSPDIRVLTAPWTRGSATVGGFLRAKQPRGP